MKQRSMRLVRLTGIVFIFASVGVALRQPAASGSGLQTTANDAHAVLQKVCGTCHALDKVTGSRRSRAQWEEVIEKMASMGAKGTSEEFATVLTYLVTNYGRDTATPPAPPAGGGPGRPPQARPVGGTAGANDKHVVDQAAVERGRKVWAAECIACHGGNARGNEKGSNLVRSELAWRDRYGNEIGALLAKGHPTQSGIASSSFTKTQVEELAHFIHQRLYDTLRGSPIFEVQNVLTGDPKAGAAYFNGEGKCSTCHSVTGDLAGIGKRYNPATLQQRFLFPRVVTRGRSGGPVGKPVMVTVTPNNGAAVTGVLVHLDDFNVSLRDAAGEYFSWKRTPTLKVVKNDPYATHIELLDKYTDKNMHDIVAYLDSLK
jgi:cytochrome c oxidase cbb3-type subunit III